MPIKSRVTCNPNSGVHPPLRQSCNRCHEKKVKCLQQPNISQSEPPTCVRCHKIGTTCIYSAPQRPGRPPAAQLAPERTSRVVSQDSVDTSFISAECYMNNFQSAETLAVGRGINRCLDCTNMEQALNETNAYSEPGTTVNTRDPFSHFQFDNIPENIGLPTFQPPDLALGLDEHLIGPSEPISWPSTFSTNHSEVKEDRSRSLDSIDAQIRDLAQLNLRVLQSSREVERDLESMQLSASSPSFNGIFEATEIFIAICRRVSEYHLDQSSFNYMSTSHSNYSLFSELDSLNPTYCRNNTSSIDTSLQPDGGVLLMMLAFHHRLTSIFETICSSIYHHLLSTDVHANITWSNTEHLKNTPQSNGHRQPSSWTRQSLSFPATTFSTNNNYDWSLSSTAQIVMLVRLIRHLADRMNQVLKPFIDYPMKPNTIPSQIPNTPPDGDYSSPSLFIEPRYSTPLLEENSPRIFTDMGNRQDQNRVVEDLESNMSLNNSIELGRKMRDLRWLHSYIDRIERLVEHPDHV